MECVESLRVRVGCVDDWVDRYGALFKGGIGCRDEGGCLRDYSGM